MARIVCQVLHRANRLTFLWSEEAASFEPYHLEGVERAALLHISDQIHATLARGTAGELGKQGHQLYRAVFRLDQGDAAAAHAVETWLRHRVQSNGVEGIEFLSDAPGRIPFSLLTEESGRDANAQHWGARFRLGEGRRVNALRANPSFLNPTVCYVVDAELNEPQAWAEQCMAGKVLGDVSALGSELARHVPDVLLLVARVTSGQLHLGAESFSIGDLLTWLDEAKEGTPDPLVILMGVGEPTEQSAWLSLLDDASASFSGLVANESLLPAAQLLPLGHQIAEQFCAGQKDLGGILQGLRKQGGSALALSAFCPLTLRAVSEGTKDPPQAETVVSTYPLPLRPYRPFAAFNAADRPLFFGRDEDTLRTALLADQARTQGIFLHGSAAVGKTSLLQAGLVPYLEQESVGYRVLRDRTPMETSATEQEYPVLTLRATNDLAGQFADALTAFCSVPMTYTTPAGTPVSVDLPGILKQVLAGCIAGTPSTAIQAPARDSLTSAEPADDDGPAALEPRELWFALRDIKDSLGKTLDAITRSLPFELVIIIDQGEELLTLVQTPQEQARRKKALAMLAHVADAAPRCKIVFALRSQAFGQLIGLLPEGRVPANWSPICLRPLSEAAMADALAWPTNREPIPYCDEIPGEKYGFAFEEGLAQEIVTQAVNASAAEQQSPLPILHAIGTLLYEKQVLQKKQDVLRAADLKEIGGAKDALGKCLDITLERLPLAKLTRAALKSLISKLYTSHADGSVSPDLTHAEDLKAYWNSGAEPVEASVNTAADEQGLFEIQHLLIGGNAGLYVSLPQDSLARLGQKIDADHEKKALARTKVIDVLWIMIPLVFLAAAVSFWATRNFVGSSSGDFQELKKAATEIIEKQKKENEALRGANQQSRQAMYLGQLALADQALRADNALRARHILLSQPAMLAYSESRDDGRLADLRGFEWRYLWRHVNSERHLVEGHRGIVNSIAVSPDSQWGASGSADGTVRIWSLAKGEALAILSGPKSAINAVAFAPDGKSLAAAGADKVIRLWDLSQLKTDFVTLSKESNVLRGHTGSVNALAYGKDGNAFASAAADKTVIVWDLAKGTPKHSLAEHAASVNALAAADDGKTLISAGADGKIVAWDFETGKKHNVQKTFYQTIAALSVSADGKTIGTAGVEARLDAELGMIRFWNVADLKETAQAIQHGTGVLSLAFGPDGKSIASGGADHVIRLWDIKERTQLHHWLGHLSSIRALAWARKGNSLASGDYEGLVKVWNPEQSSGPDVIQAHGDWVQCLALDAKSTLLASGARDGTVRLWNPGDATPIKDLPQHTGAVTALAFSQHKDKRLLAVSTRDDKNQGEVKVWQIDQDAKLGYQPKLLQTLRDRKEGVTCLAFHPRTEKADLLVCGDTDATVRLWNAATGKEVEIYRGHKEEVRCVAFLQDGRAFVSGGKDGLLCYAEIDRKEVWPSKELHLGAIESLTLMPLPPLDGGDMRETESALVTGGADHTVKLWLVEKDDPKQKIDGRKNLKHHRTHTQTVSSLAYNDGRAGLIVSASWDGAIKLYDRASERFTLTGHRGAVRAVAIAADQSFVVSAGNDGTIRIWRAARERALEK